MADPYASVTDLEQAWRPLSDTEKTRATYLLGKASRQLRAEAPDLDARTLLAPDDPDYLDRELVKDVVCAMVKRVMEAEASGLNAGGPVESWQTSVGPFQDSFRYTNPTGDMYLTKAEKRLLGVGGQTVFTVSMAPPAPTNPYWWEL